VEKKQFGRILCGISTNGTKKGHKNQLLRAIEREIACVDGAERMPSGLRTAWDN
jgi:hypothetical protein